jgi:DNA-binding NarL/FixJ family response regulator
MTTTKPTVLVADDHAEFLESITALLSRDFDIACAVSDGAAALVAATQLNPDIVIMDIAMPYLDGIRAARGIQRNGATSRIVFVTANEDPDLMASAFACGAYGYVIKSRLNSDLLHAIEEALAGRTFASPVRAKRATVSARNGSKKPT